MVHRKIVNTRFLQAFTNSELTKSNYSRLM